MDIYIYIYLLYRRLITEPCREICATRGTKCSNLSLFWAKWSICALMHLFSIKSWGNRCNYGSPLALHSKKNTCSVINEQGGLFFSDFPLRSKNRLKEPESRWPFQEVVILICSSGLCNLVNDRAWNTFARDNSLSFSYMGNKTTWTALYNFTSWGWGRNKTLTPSY